MLSKTRRGWIGALLGVALLVGGCSGDDGEDPADGGGLLDGEVLTDAGGDDSGEPSDTGAKADAAGPLTALKVAAVQYAKGAYGAVSGCDSDLCALEHFVTEAAQSGAHLVVTPEYAVSQSSAEAAPEVGDAVVGDSRWPAASIIGTMGKLADDLNLTLVFNLVTQEGTGSAAKLHNTSLAVDAGGKVLARHYKFQLFGGEASQLTPGASLEHTFFDTPAGRAGLLICADVQCIITGLQVTPDCSAHAKQMLTTYFSTANKPDLVLFSAFWTIGPSNPTWYSVNVQKTVAQQGSVWLAAANTTDGAGYGGGIYKPSGEPLKSVTSTSPTVVYGEIPIPQ